MGLNDRFRPEWKAAGYPFGNGSAAVVPPPEKGYKRLYYLTGPDHAISNIVFKRIKVSRFSELKDPFELLGANFANKDLRRIVRAHKDDLDSQYGLICFSEGWIDPVLWSHKHRGVALGFDVDTLIAKQVSYQSARLREKLPTGTSDITPMLTELLICTKYESWKYEREWRILAPLKKANQEGHLYFSPYNIRLKLVEVILGPACSLALKKVRSLVDSRYTGVTTFKARLAYRSFRVIAHGSSVPTI